MAILRDADLKSAVEFSRDHRNAPIFIGREYAVITFDSNCKKENEYTEFVQTLFYHGHPIVQHKHLKAGRILSLFHAFSSSKTDKQLRTRFNKVAEQVFGTEVHPMDLHE